MPFKERFQLLSNEGWLILVSDTLPMRLFAHLCMLTLCADKPKISNHSQPQPSAAHSIKPAICCSSRTLLEASTSMGPSLLVLKMLTRLKSSSRNGKTLNRLSQPELVLVILTIHTLHSQYEHNAVVEALVFTTPGDWLLQLNHGGRLHQPVESRCLG